MINALKLHPIFTSPLNTLTLAMCLCAGLGGGATLIAFSYLPGYGLVLAAGGVAAFAWSVWALVRTYSTIELAVKVLEGGAVGNLEQRLVHIGRGRDTLSRLCRATNNVLDAADSFARESNASLKEVTAGRFHRRILADGMHRAYKHSATTINQMTENLGIRIRENSALAAKFRESVNARVTEGAAITQATRSDAETMQMATHDALTQSAEVFEVAQATLREVEAVAQSTEELSLALDDVRSQVNRATLIAEDAEREVEAAQGVFTALADTARHIEKVTAIINKISAQTNLLALNATSRPAGPGKPARAFPSSPTKSRTWPTRPPRRPAISAARSPRSRKAPCAPSTPCRRSARPSAKSARSPIRSTIPWPGKAPRHRPSPAPAAMFAGASNTRPPRWKKSPSRRSNRPKWPNGCSSAQPPERKTPSS